MEVIKLAIAKVILNGETLMDVTSNTVTSETLLSGQIATGSNGEPITGSFKDQLIDLVQGSPRGGGYFNEGAPAIGVLSQASRIKFGAYANVNFIYNQNISLPYASYISSYAFCNCAWLSSVDAPLCQSVGSYAFASCNKLTSISFPICASIDDYGFYRCSSLLEANFPSCSIIRPSTFQECSKLITGNFPLCTSVYAYAFIRCYSLESINLPICNYIGDYAFNFCSNIININLPSCNSIGTYAFAYCSSLTNISINSAYSRIASHTFRGCILLNSFNFNNITSIGSYAFCECDFKTLVFSLISKESFLSNNTFGSNYNLSYVFLNNTLSTGSVDIYMTFANCSRLLSLYLLGTASYYNGYNSMFLSGTPMSNNTTYTDGVYGSIYVPASYYDMYISTRGWSNYASRIVSLTDSEIAALSFI